MRAVEFARIMSYILYTYGNGILFLWLLFVSGRFDMIYLDFHENGVSYLLRLPCAQFLLIACTFRYLICWICMAVICVTITRPMTDALETLDSIFMHKLNAEIDAAESEQTRKTEEEKVHPPPSYDIVFNENV